MKRQYIRICPRCGSADWKVSSKAQIVRGAFPSELGRIGVAADNIECNNCGFIGPSVEMEAKKVKELQKKLKKRGKKK